MSFIKDLITEHLVGKYINIPEEDLDYIKLFSDEEIFKAIDCLDLNSIQCCKIDWSNLKYSLLNTYLHKVLNTYPCKIKMSYESDYTIKFTITIYIDSDMYDSTLLEMMYIISNDPKIKPFNDLMYIKFDYINED